MTRKLSGGTYVLLRFFVAPLLENSLQQALEFAVSAISEGLRHEVGGNIRTTSIAPGAVESELKLEAPIKKVPILLKILSISYTRRCDSQNHCICYRTTS
jgi:NAD(P)-dependent dehydrogenase (short-subunit alcohol dehydrogenase family)